MKSVKAKTEKNVVMRYNAINSWFLSPKGDGFLLLESFGIRKNMFWCWQEDGGRNLPTRFMKTAKQSTLCQTFEKSSLWFLFLNRTQDITSEPLFAAKLTE